ncbi:Eae protein [Escherichia coli]
MISKNVGMKNSTQAEKLIRGNILTTEEFLSGLWGMARDEGINYTADRVATAYNNGFINKPLTDIFQIVNMILSSKRELANSASPAAGGLSGEYATTALNEWEGKIRNGYCK